MLKKLIPITLIRSRHRVYKLLCHDLCKCIYLFFCILAYWLMPSKLAGMPNLADLEVPASCAILILLFALQHYGTHRVGFLFAPVVLAWLFCTSAIGTYNIFRWNPHVYQALSPLYMYTYLRKTKREGWLSLGGIILSISGKQ